MFEHVPRCQQPIGYQNVNVIDLTNVRGGGNTYPPLTMLSIWKIAK